MAAPLFHFTEKPGPHAVGLRVVEQYDYSRIHRRPLDGLGKRHQGERARPLQTLIWYPAERGPEKPMTVGDYVNLWATETRFGRPRLPVRAQECLVGMKQTLTMSLWAVRDAPPVASRFPIMIYAPSYSAPSWENADLCEYLASHGYLVLASPSMGAMTRKMTLDLPGIEAQARDISFLIGYAQGLPNADLSGVAVTGFSWGGISNVFAAACDSRITALVAFDGSLRFSPGLVHKSGYVRPDQMTIPLLSIAQGLWTPEDKALVLDSSPEFGGPDVLNAWTHGDLVNIHLFALNHGEFSSMFQRDEGMWRKAAYLGLTERADYGRADGIPGYAWLARYTLSFLDAYLKHDAAALAFLRNKPVENGVPRHFMTVNHRAAVGAPISFESFCAEIGSRGFDHIAEIHAGFRQRNAGFKLDQNAVDAWAEELMEDDHFPEAIALLRLNVQMYGDSSDAHARLGHAYRRSGQVQPAIESYRTALKKDAMNAIAGEKLQDLLAGVRIV